MRILDRYITKSIITIFLSAIFIFCFLYVLIDAAGHLDDFIENKVPIMVVGQYYLSFLPIILIHSSPIACLLATLFTYTALNNNNEVIALRASGLSFWQITRPAICFSMIIACFVFLINEKYVPQASVISEEIKDQQIEAGAHTKKNKAKPSITNLAFYGLRNRLYFIDEFNPNTFKISGVTIIEQNRNQQMTQKIIAGSGEWTGIAWKFFNVQISDYFPDNPGTPTDLRVYPDRLMDIKETPQDFMRQRLEIASMNIQQLSEYISRFRSSGATSIVRDLQVDLHQKFSYPIGTIVIVLAGLPFALRTGRRAMTFTSAGIALSIGFLFYVCNSVGLALGKGGALPPFYAAWLAPIVFLAAAAYLIKKLF